MNKAGSRILQGAKEALAFMQGQDEATGFSVHLPPSVDVKAIRHKTGLSQRAFAARYGFSFGRVRDWEQGRSNIDGPSRLLLTIIDKEPEAVERALSAA
uniref:Antitoxin of toxin-antitoxin n=1 Tax=Ochrobactrum sp. LM19 TaxID=1449781 RepID=A0A0D5A1F1_9HYPH|nr:transcriptional regulator [Ochrobactrum sp. LM19]AJW30028.1 antitoxin of toxin-antitoxin [Ochrobactrum sp. LM19]